MLDALSRLPERIGERIEPVTEPVDDVLDAAWKRVAAVGTGIAALISALLVGNLSLVGTIVAIPGQVYAFIVALPGMVWAFIASIPGIIWGWLASGGTAAVGATTGLLESWGMSFLATGVAVVADQPWIAGVLALGIIVAKVGPADFREDFKFMIQLLLLAVFGYVAALTVGDGLLEAIPLVMSP